MNLSLRARIAGGSALIAVGLVLSLSSAVFLQVRSDRLAAMDRALSDRAADLATRIERDRGQFELEPSREPLRDGLGYAVRSTDGELLFAQGPLDPATARILEQTHRVRSDPGEPVPVRVAVAEDLRPLRAELSALIRTLVAVGAGATLLALALSAWLSDRIVRPLAQIAQSARAVKPGERSPALVGTGSGDAVDQLVHALNQAFSRVLEAHERQTRFTADASHELRTPLAVIRTQAEVALRRERSPEQLRETLGDILAASVRATELIEGLLALARAEQGAPAAPVRTDLAEVARTAALPWAERVQIQGPERVAVQGDPRALGIVVRNLLANAVRHSPADSPVVVRIRERADRVELAVTDRGPGIPQDQLEAVFERFYRVDDARSRSAGGTGLGLAIARAAAQSQAGTLTLECPGTGTVATLTLPRLSAGTSG